MKRTFNLSDIADILMGVSDCCFDYLVKTGENEMEADSPLDLMIQIVQKSNVNADTEGWLEGGIRELFGGQNEKE